MTDEELSMLLRQWERIPAPRSLDARVFSARKNRRWVFPAPVVAFSGAAVGVLGVLGVLRLTVPVAHTPPPAPVVEQVALPAAPPVLAPPTPAVAIKPKVKRIVTFAMDPMQAARKVLTAPPPVYPPEAREALVEGQVKLRIRIGRDGRVIDAEVLNGDPLLVDAAMESVKQWLYEPTVLNGVPVEVITQVDVNFTLLDRKPRPVKKQ
jgi:TonB family protein